MTNAQRAAFVELMRIGRQMSNACYTLGRRDTVDVSRWPHDRDTLRELQEQWDAAHSRYFELEAEARNAKSSARKSRGAVRQKGGVNQPKNSNV